MKKLPKVSRVIAIFLLFLTGVNAIIAGTIFIIDPTGKTMGMSTSYLSNSSFQNFLVPGIILFVVNGLLNVMVAILSIKKYKYFPILIIIQGLMLLGWIIIQVLLVRDFNGLHFSMLSIGTLLMIFGLILYSAFYSPDPHLNFDANTNDSTTKRQNR